MNFNTGVRVLHTTTGVVGNVVSATEDQVTLRTPEGGEVCCDKTECKTLRGRPRKMA